MEPGDPLGGDAPYDILGAERSASLVEVRDRRDELIETYERRKADARRDGDHEAFKRAVDSLSVVESAWSRIRDTHEASDDAGVDAEASVESRAASPLDGDGPYEVLGVAETDSLETIRRRSQELLERYAEQRADAKRDGDDDRFKRALDRVKRTDAAWSWIRQNHESTAETAAASDASALRTPYSVLSVSSEESLGEIKARRDDLLRQELEKLSVEAYEFDRLRFREALTNVRAIDEVYERLAAEEPTDGRA